MLRHWTILAAVAAVFTSASAQDLPAVDHAVVARAAAVCTAEGAFGHKFGEKGPGGTRFTVKLGSDWVPFRDIALGFTSRSNQLHSLEASGWFDPNTPTAQAKAMTKQFFDALNTEIAATRQFAKRDVEEDHVTYHFTTEGKDGFTFEVTRMGAGLYLDCTDNGLQKLIYREAFGQVPATRPTPPELKLPPRPAADFCADPAKQSVDLNDLVSNMGNYSSASSNYFTQLSDWKGQQLVDKKVWTKKQKTAFSLGLMKDPVIAKGFAQNMSRLKSFMNDVMAYGDAKKPAVQCAAALRVLNNLHDMQDSNEIQWKRVMELYDIEARKHNVTLE